MVQGLARKNLWATVDVICRLSLILAATAVASCSIVEGYPHDPEDTAATLTKLAPYFDSAKDDEYLAAQAINDEANARKLRDSIVMNRMHAYDIEYDNFKKSLTSYGNTLTTGSDLVVLILNGVGATIGGAGAKSALAAASGGVVGAQGDINKDLFFQKTIPAIISQMDANRDKAALPLVSGMNQDTSKYSLQTAERDLEHYKIAGNVVDAISNITQQAQNAKDTAQDQIQSYRTSVFGADASTQKIQAWLWPGVKIFDADGHALDANGKAVAANANHVAALRQWIADNNLVGLPIGSFLNNKDLAGARASAIKALSIP
jgi:hypothetical protein